MEHTEVERAVVQEEQERVFRLEERGAPHVEQRAEVGRVSARRSLRRQPRAPLQVLVLRREPVEASAQLEAVHLRRPPFTFIRRLRDRFVRAPRCPRLAQHVEALLPARLRDAFAELLVNRDKENTPPNFMC